jgi:Pro-kumamolisin, activation domain/IPT/TIG domain
MKRIALACALAGGVSLALVGFSPAVSTSAATLRGPWKPVAAAPRIPVGARAVGAVPGDARITGSVVLKPRDEQALTSFIAAVTSPQSGLFGHYLKPGTFAAMFGPTSSAIGSVASVLGADGLRVTSVARDGLLVDFAGSASSAERAFGTGLETYRLAGGSTGTATTGAIRLPDDIAADVAAVVGLDSLVHPEPIQVLHGSAAGARSRRRAVAQAFRHPAGSPDACKAAQVAAQKNGGLTDDEIAHAYGAFGLYGKGDLGAGQHIAIYEEDPFLTSDIRTFDTCYFGAKAAAKMARRLHVVAVDGGEPTGTGFGEAVLDIENISAMAPDAQLDVYEAPFSTFASLDEYAAIVNSDSDQVVSTSYGLCEQAFQLSAPGFQQAENFLFQQAAAQGQSIFAASGDNGSDDCNTLYAPSPPAGQNPVSVDDPGSQPYVISAGGTSIDNAATQPPTEQVWNDGPEWGAGGGGISMSWAMPSWQRASLVPGVVLPGSKDYSQANAVETEFGYPAGFCQAYLTGATAQTPCRTVPDVSAQADEFTGSITVYQGGWTTYGGTSSSAPTWAGLLAVINASAACKASPATRHGVGFASPLLYAVASSPAVYKASFNDIRLGNNDVDGLDDGLVFPTAKGYDLASGLGSPRLTSARGGAGLAYYLCSYGSSAARPAVTGLSPPVLPTTGGKVTISGSGFERGGASAVAGIQVGTWHVPAEDFTVTSATTIRAMFPPAADTLPPGSPAPLDGAGPAQVLVSAAGGATSPPDWAAKLQYADEANGSPVPSVTGLSPDGGLDTAPRPITILGSGFSGATAVTFGGVPAASFTVRTPFEIIAAPPAYSGATTCSPSTSGQNPATDVCQTQVRVTGPQGTGTTSTILPPLEGTLPQAGPLGVIAAPAGCGCEVDQAPTEFDYVPEPKVTSVSTSAADPGSLASEAGGTLITVTGQGFNYLTMDWADFGDPSQASSVSTAFVSLTGTQIQIMASAAVTTTSPARIPFSVLTLGGQSPDFDVTYAGVPSVKRVVATRTGRNGGPDTGGTPVMVSGQGFGQAVGPINFADANFGVSLGTQYTYTVVSGGTITTQTVQQTPAVVDVQVCSVSGCSYDPPDDYFYLYQPGNPKVEAIDPRAGPAHGGTRVTITGQNLGCVTGVFFGKAPAKKFSNAPTPLGCGSSTVVRATAPPGKAGSRVRVTINTVESNFTGHRRSTSTAYFTYRR